MSNLLKLYHHAPYPLRVLAASARGYYLRRWRYGPETDQVIDEALEREYWSPQKWNSWQKERLAYMLHRSATKVPFYSEHWSARRRRGDKVSWEYLENWPILRKESVRERPHAFVADDCDIQRMFPDHTSGTTGKPLHLWLNRKTVREWYGINEARVKMWNGVSRIDRWAILGGQLIVPYEQTHPPFWVWNAGLQQLYMSSYHLATEFVPTYFEAMHKYKITYILGYASSMYSLAQIGRECNIEPPIIQVAISNAETLYQHQRDLISEVFQCPTVDTYGMVELVAAASECNKGSLHLWPEVGIVEVMHPNDDTQLLSGEIGRFVCTGLLNCDMPLIRYDVGDLGALSSNGKECICHRTLPIIQHIEGRTDDIVITPDGRRVGRLGPVFRGDLPIREVQITQESLESIQVRIVSAPGYTASTGEVIVQRLRERLGNMEISLELVEKIPRSANGKFRVVVSKLTREQQQLKNR